MNKYQSSRLFQFFAIIIIGGLCLLLDSLTQIHYNKAHLPKNSPEYNATGVTGKVLNRKGELQYRLTSEKAWKFPKDKRIFLSKLHLFLYNESTGVLKYSVASDDGWINHVAKIGFLGKHVVSVINNKNPKKVVTLYGKNVDVDFNKRLFTSKDNVKVVQDKKVVTSHGFSYDSRRGFLTLNSRVTVVYGSSLKSKVD